MGLLTLCRDRSSDPTRDPAGGSHDPTCTTAACSSDAGSGEQTDVDDDAVRQAVAASEQGLIRQYDAAIAAYPSLESKLAPLRDQHVEHLTAVGGQPSNDSGSQSTPKTAAAAVQQLTASERKAAAERTASCGKATSGDLIWNLALIASSESQHAAVLARADNGGPVDRQPHPSIEW